MVSGVGPKETLEALNIPVFADLAGVGQNMWVSWRYYILYLWQKLTISQDHIAFSPAYAVDLTTHSQLSSSPFAATQVTEYLANRTGMLTNCGGDILGLNTKRDFTQLANFVSRLYQSSCREYQ